MIWTRQLRGFLWIVLALVIPCGWCGPLAAAPYSGGDGTAETPYLVSTAQDLATLANTQADWGKWFILTGDIDLKSTPLAKPIGSRPAPFTGVFDGGRHSIRGLAVDDTTSITTPFGLFGFVGLPAVIERVRLIAPSIKTNGDASTGALVGEVGKGATVQQCSVEGGSVFTPASGAAGGLVGDNGGTVRECFSTTSVTALGLAGALLGRSTGLVENCSAAGAVTTLKVGTGTASGGLSGADVGGTIRFCLALSPSLTGARVGGLVGYASLTTKISNSLCNKVTARAVENWPADVPGSASCEDASNLASSAFFTEQGWDLQGAWFMDAGGSLRLRWASGGLTAVAKGPSGTVQPDAGTGLARITLDGTASNDPDGNELRYSWKCLTSSGDSTGITIQPVANPTVDLPAGTYRIELIVNNGQADSAPATLTFTVGSAAPKGPPTAVVKGPTGVVRPDPVTGLAKITLDGSQSTDPNKKELKYSWKCLTSSGGATGVTINPEPSPSVSLRSGSYRIELTVSNGTATSAPAVLAVSVNGAPTAMIKAPNGNLAPDTTGVARLVLDGSASSDPDKDPLKYRWQCLTSSGGATGVTIDPVASPSVSLRAGTYRIELTVNDGAGDSAPTAVVLTVGGTNKPPTAVIRELKGTVRTDPATGLATIALDGSQSSDPDKDALKYSWTCLTAAGVPTGIPINPVVNPSVGLRAGTYRIELTVNDGKTESAPAAITVTTVDNGVPTALVKGPEGVVRPDAKTGLAQIVLDGSSSSDPEGDALKYRWRCLTASGAATTVALAPVAKPSVNLAGGTYKIELVVNDGVADSAPCTVPITVNTPPTAKAGDSQNLFDNGSGMQMVKLDGSRSFDPEAGKGQTLVYSWTCATATPGAASGPTASMTFPVGTHTVLLTVSDGMDSAQDKMQVTVLPALSGARMASSPATLGRTSTVADVKLYLLLPTGKSCSDVDAQVPMYLDLNGTRVPLARDPTYSHKKYTVVTVADRQKILTAAGATNGSKAATVTLHLKTGETVCGALRFEVVAGFGPNLATVLTERTVYYFDTKIWR